MKNLVLRRMLTIAWRKNENQKGQVNAAKLWRCGRNNYYSADGDTKFTIIGDSFESPKEEIK
jgi:hypothetical protein